MPDVGTIVRLQVQSSSLKQGVAPRRWYDPTPIVPVPVVRITADGVIGMRETGDDVIDVHNRLHPGSKNRGNNGISIGFVTHYDAMREQFGDHLSDGIAGENILVEVDHMVEAGEVAQGLVIRTSGGQEVRLADVIIAPPCVEFGRFALRFPHDAKSDRAVTEAVQFLNEGMRGYYARYDGPAVEIAVGDAVVLP